MKAKKISISIVLMIIITLMLIIGRKQNVVHHYEAFPDITVSAVHSDYVFSTVRSNEIKPRAYREDAGMTAVNIYQMDVWDLGEYLYGISYLDTSRSLKLITYEGYGYSPLSYYVACCCWTRATENYWGYGNLFSAFGEADESYDLWMDDLGVADWAIDALYECYLDPMYVRYCNGMATPTDYIYCEWDGSYMIYVWN